MTKTKMSNNSTDQVINEIPKLTTVVNELRQEVNLMRTSLNELCKSTEHVSNTTDKIEKHITVIDNRLSNMDKVIEEAQQNYCELLNKYNELNERMTDMESRSKRDNLLFTGVPETPKESSDDCMRKIREILKNSLSIENAESLQIVSCYRKGVPPSTNAGASAPGRPRAVFCKFHSFGDRQKIWKAKTKLRGTQYAVQEDFPKEILERRKVLLPIMFAARRMKYTAYLTVDKLHIVTQENDKSIHNVYDTKTLDKLPESLDLKNVCTVKKGNMLAFFGSHCPLSNFHAAPFTSEGQKYRHVEEYLFIKKAEFAQDDVAKKKIFAASTPAECKSIGRNIKVDFQQWRTKEIDVMKAALFEKFHQNPHLKDYLVNTNEQTLAEASPSDRFWGIGAGLGQVASRQEQTFTGKNKLGELLMELRTQLR